MKGLFFSQYLFIPDLPVLSLSLCARLVQEFDIDFLYGSPIPRMPIVMPRLHLLQLPPFPVNTLEKKWKPSEKKVQKVKRKEFIQQSVKPPYAFFMTEIFPFGKMFMREETFALMERLKRSNPACLMLCSLPDIVGAQSPSIHEKAIEIFSEHYDAVFVHADPTIIPLEESFKLPDSLRSRVIYTGFVPNNLEAPKAPSKREKRILVPIAAAAVGEVMVRAILTVTEHFPDYEFFFVLPRNSPAFLEETINAWAKRQPRPAIRALPFQTSLEGLLRSSALSISIAEPLLIDLVYTQTPGVVFAVGSEGNLKRMNIFAARNLVTVMQAADLEPTRLRQLIEKALITPYSDHKIDTKGAEHTLQKLKMLIESRRKAK